MAKGDRRVEIRCPKCGWEPRQNDQWACFSCHFAWNTFDTGGVCPACGKSHEDTQCPACHSWSRHRAWYHEFGFEEDAETHQEKEPEKVETEP